MTTTQPNSQQQRYRTQVINDLAWVIGSPSLIAPSFAETTDLDTLLIADDTWCQQHLQQFTPHLSAADQDHTQLQHILQSQNDRRLGAYFEDLILYWLQQSDQFDLIAHRLPVRTTEKTIGEFDFIVRNRKTQEHEHWEVAVKFYLGTRALNDWHNWLGPGKKDTLAKKLNHLRQKQSRLTQHPAAQQTLKEMGITTITPRLFIKGRLFYPLQWGNEVPPPHINPAHLKGWWCTQADFHMKANDKSRWQPLSKFDWLTTHIDGDDLASMMNKTDLICSEGFPVQGFPRCVIEYQDGEEISRGFIVPDDWV